MPSIAIGMWWPGIGVRRAVLVVLADARPEHDRAGERRDAADHVHDDGAGEVDVAVAEAEVRAELPTSQPPPQTQLPIERVDEHRHEEARTRRTP